MEKKATVLCFTNNTLIAAMYYIVAVYSGI